MPRTEGSETFPVVGDRLMVNISNTGVIHRPCIVTKGVSHTVVNVRAFPDPEDTWFPSASAFAGLTEGMGYLNWSWPVDTLS